MILPIYLDSPRHFFEGFGKEPNSAIPYYKKLGFTNIEKPKEHEYFVEADAPNGWTVEYEGYWTYLYDNKHLQRFSFFSKQTPWDTDGFTRPNTRYGIRRDWSMVNLSDMEADSKVRYYVKDSDNGLSGDDATRLYECKVVVVKNNSRKYAPETEEARIERVKMYDKENDIEKTQIDECKKWLSENYPNWEDIYAYWE